MIVQSNSSACPKLLRESGAQMSFVWHLSHHTDSSECIMPILLFMNCFPTTPGCGRVNLCSLNITTCPTDSWVLLGAFLALGHSLAFGSNILPYCFQSSFWDSAKALALSGFHWLQRFRENKQVTYRGFFQKNDFTALSVPIPHHPGTTYFQKISNN